jgi:ribosomal protein S18 acetylase RimI-like enzyme
VTGSGAGEPGVPQTCPVAAGEDAALFQLFAVIRTEELAMDGWDSTLRDLVLRQQFHAWRMGHRTQYPAASELLILLEDRPVGWIVVDRSAPTWRCIDIAIAPEFRRRKIASRILRTLQEEAAAARSAISLMVLHSNAGARTLYDGLGFRPSGGTDTHCYMEWRA